MAATDDHEVAFNISGIFTWAWTLKDDFVGQHGFVVDGKPLEDRFWNLNTLQTRLATRLECPLADVVRMVETKGVGGDVPKKKFSAAARKDVLRRVLYAAELAVDTGEMPDGFQDVESGMVITVQTTAEENDGSGSDSSMPGLEEQSDTDGHSDGSFNAGSGDDSDGLQAQAEAFNVDSSSSSSSDAADSSQEDEPTEAGRVKAAVKASLATLAKEDAGLAAALSASMVAYNQKALKNGKPGAKAKRMRKKKAAKKAQQQAAAASDTDEDMPGLDGSDSSSESDEESGEEEKRKVRHSKSHDQRARSAKRRKKSSKKSKKKKHSKKPRKSGAIPVPLESSSSSGESTSGSESDGVAQGMLDRAQTKAWKKARRDGVVNSRGRIDLDKTASVKRQVNAKLHKKIVGGELDVSIALILSPTAGKHSAKLGKTWVGVSLDKEAWLEGWTILASILVQMGSRQCEMDEYRALIVGFFDDYKVTLPDGAATYDAMYRLHASQAFWSTGGGMPTFTFSQRTFNQVFSTVRVGRCSICRHPDHTDAQHFQLERAANTAAAGAGGGGGRGGAAKAGAGVVPTVVPKGKGQGACFDWNGGTCAYGAKCRFLHVCKSCKGAHKVAACTKPA